jgi:hypothetical protein
MRTSGRLLVLLAASTARAQIYPLEQHQDIIGKAGHTEARQQDIFAPTSTIEPSSRLTPSASGKWIGKRRSA